MTTHQPDLCHGILLQNCTYTTLFLTHIPVIPGSTYTYTDNMSIPPHQSYPQWPLSKNLAYTGNQQNHSQNTHDESSRTDALANDHNEHSVVSQFGSSHHQALMSSQSNHISRMSQLQFFGGSNHNEILMRPMSKSNLAIRSSHETNHEINKSTQVVGSIASQNLDLEQRFYHQDHQFHMPYKDTTFERNLQQSHHKRNMNTMEQHVLPGLPTESILQLPHYQTSQTISSSNSWHHQTGSLNTPQISVGNHKSSIDKSSSHLDTNTRISDQNGKTINSATNTNMPSHSQPYVPLSASLWQEVPPNVSVKNPSSLSLKANMFEDNGINGIHGFDSHHLHKSTRQTNVDNICNVISSSRNMSLKSEHVKVLVPVSQHPVSSSQHVQLLKHHSTTKTTTHVLPSINTLISDNIAYVKTDWNSNFAQQIKNATIHPGSASEIDIKIQRPSETSLYFSPSNIEYHSPKTGSVNFPHQGNNTDRTHVIVQNSKTQKDRILEIIEQEKEKNCLSGFREGEDTSSAPIPKKKKRNRKQNTVAKHLSQTCVANYSRAQEDIYNEGQRNTFYAPASNNNTTSFLSSNIVQPHHSQSNPQLSYPHPSELHPPTHTVNLDQSLYSTRIFNAPSNPLHYKQTYDNQKSNTETLANDGYHLTYQNQSSNSNLLSMGQSCNVQKLQTSESAKTPDFSQSESMPRQSPYNGQRQHQAQSYNSFNPRPQVHTLHNSSTPQSNYDSNLNVVSQQNSLQNLSPTNKILPSIDINSSMNHQNNMQNHNIGQQFFEDHPYCISPDKLTKNMNINSKSGSVQHQQKSHYPENKNEFNNVPSSIPVLQETNVFYKQHIPSSTETLINNFKSPKDLTYVISAKSTASIHSQENISQPNSTPFNLSSNAQTRTSVSDGHPSKKMLYGHFNKGTIQKAATAKRTKMLNLNQIGKRRKKKIEAFASVKRNDNNCNSNSAMPKSSNKIPQNDYVYKLNGSKIDAADLDVDQDLVDRLTNNRVEMADCKCLGLDCK